MLRTTLVAAAWATFLARGEPEGSAAAPFIRTLYLQYVDGEPEGHFALGRAIGEALGGDLRETFAADAELRSLEAWIETPAGAVIWKNFTDTTTAHYPLYTREVEGMAAGAKLPVRTMMLNNFREELVQWTDPVLAAGVGTHGRRRPVREGHCTDAYIVDRKRGLTAWGHNDDWEVNWRKAAYFVIATALNKDGSIKLKFGSWMYPGYLLGMQLVWNSHGLAWTVNSLFPEEFWPGGVGTAWVARDMVYATDVADAARRAAPKLVSTAMNYNIGRLGTDSLFNLEVTTGGVHAVHQVDDLYIHTNKFKVLDVKELSVNSSIHREARWAQLRPGSIEALRGFLSDNADTEYPVYRDGPVFTEITGIFDLKQRTLSAWSTASAKSPPALVLPLDFPGMPQPSSGDNEVILT